jgi:hypothetical protein
MADFFDQNPYLRRHQVTPEQQRAYDRYVLSRMPLGAGAAGDQAGMPIQPLTGIPAPDADGVGTTGLDAQPRPRHRRRPPCHSPVQTAHRSSRHPCRYRTGCQLAFRSAQCSSTAFRCIPIQTHQRTCRFRRRACSPASTRCTTPWRTITGNRRTTWKIPTCQDARDAGAEPLAGRHSLCV